MNTANIGDHSMPKPNELNGVPAQTPDSQEWVDDLVKQLPLEGPTQEELDKYPQLQWAWSQYKMIRALVL